MDNVENGKRNGRIRTPPHLGGKKGGGAMVPAKIAVRIRIESGKASSPDEA